MKVETLTYTDDKGWSVKAFPKMDSPQTLALVFCSPDFFDNTKPFAELKKAYPNAIFAGCSTSGEIHNDFIHDKSISIAIMKFDHTKVASANMIIENQFDSFDIGKKLGEQLNQKDLKSILIFSDGLKVNGTSLVNGLKQSVSNNVIITGGLAGDGSAFKRTWVLDNLKPTTNCVSAIGFYGNNIEFGFGCKGGWDIFGPERLITRSVGNILYEIDGEPALQLYKKYLGEKAKDLPSAGLLFPLAIREKPLNSEYVVRTILSVNEKDQSMIFAGDIPQGWYAQFMKANFDRLIEGASVAGQLAKNQINFNKDTLGIAISCVGRRLVLGERADEEVEATREMLGGTVPLVGFYSYGEISPSGLSNSDLHNQTMTVTTISER